MGQVHHITFHSLKVTPPDFKHNPSRQNKKVNPSLNVNYFLKDSECATDCNAGL